MTKEDAIEALKALIEIPMNDVNRMFELAEKKDWVGLRRLVKQMKKRKAKYGI